MGLGEFYYAANNNATNAGSAFISQAFITLKSAGSNDGRLQLGRFTFNDGAELQPQEPTLAWDQQNRISQRLLGDAAWSGIGRSFDGVHLSYGPDTSSNVTFMAGRPTEGVYAVNGWDDLNIYALYLGYTRNLAAGISQSEIRGFAFGYIDDRGLLKVDNRPLAEREADTKAIAIGTFGFDYLFTIPSPVGRWDIVMWGAYQGGQWGVQNQRSEGGLGELGWQLPWKRLRPWLRASASYASGDHNPYDNVHGTFVQMLPSQRMYAQFPYYALQNLVDYTGQCILRPTERFSIRAELHKTKLDDHDDLWYQGSGAFQPSTFGYVGVSSVGKNQKGSIGGGLANYIGVQADYQIAKSWRVSAYAAGLSGKGVMTPLLHGRKAGMAYSEVEYTF
jgi:hypothetical protein